MRLLSSGKSAISQERRIMPDINVRIRLRLSTRTADGVLQVRRHLRRAVEVLALTDETRPAARMKRCAIGEELLPNVAPGRHNPHGHETTYSSKRA